jgi:hypothetical protein
MIDLLSVVGPVIFKGGTIADYTIEILSNGGLGTRHLPSGSMVPHVLSKIPVESLTQNVNVRVPSKFAQVASETSSIALQAAQPWLAAANLGVNLLNLGVSAWTAWKVHKMDGKLDRIGVGVERIDGKINEVSHFLGASVLHLDHLIRGNSLLLGTIIENQGQMNHSVALLREEIARGFRSVNETFTSIEATRNAQELEQKMRELLRYYELCTREMEQGRQPPQVDLRRIIDVATVLIAWLDTRVATIPVGGSERLPLLIARSFALRLEFDARNQLDEASTGRTGEFEYLRGVIRDELQALTEGSTVLALATEHRELIEQYIYLSRALNGSATMVEFADGSMVTYYPQNMLTWNDGLERIRVSASHRVDGPAPAQLELKTLEEHHSLQRLMNLPRGATGDDIERDALARALGLSCSDEVSETGMRELLLAAASSLADARARIKSEAK